MTASLFLEANRSTMATPDNLQRILDYMSAHPDIFSKEDIRNRTQQMWDHQLQAMTQPSSSAPSSSSAITVSGPSGTQSRVPQVTPQPIWSLDKGGWNLITFMDKKGIPFPASVPVGSRKGSGMIHGQEPDTNGFFRAYDHALGFIMCLKSGKYSSCIKLCVYWTNFIFLLQKYKRKRLVSWRRQKKVVEMVHSTCPR